MTSASDPKLRRQYAAIAESWYDNYGIDAGDPGIVPWPVIESIVDIESQGDPSNVTGTAVGLMQVTPNGGEASYYKERTGDTPTKDALLNPGYNLQVGIAGLANDEHTVTRLGYPGWHNAGQMYWGGFLNGKPNPDASDGNFHGLQYRDTMVDYWAENFGDNTASYLSKDSWFGRHGSPLTSDEQGRPQGTDEQRQVDNEITLFTGSFDSLWDWIPGTGAIKNAISDAQSAEETIAGFVDALNDSGTWIRAGFVATGLVALAVGLVAVSMQ